MERVATILEDDPLPRVAAVLSACRGVTDALLALVKGAEGQDEADAERLEAIRQRHAGIARTLLDGPGAAEYIEELTRNCADIAGILQTVRLLRFASPVVHDLVAGYGEIWSTRLFARYLQTRGRRPGGVQWIDARDIVEIDAAPLGPTVLAHSRRQDQALLQQLGDTIDPAGYFRVIAAEGDARRVCGLPPTYTVLEALRPGRGKLLHYDQYVHPDGDESVSFASVAFYDE